jgi:hypothetical protein
MSKLLKAGAALDLRQARPGNSDLLGDPCLRPFPGLAVA